MQKINTNAIINVRVHVSVRITPNALTEATVLNRLSEDRKLNSSTPSTANYGVWGNAKNELNCAQLVSKLILLVS